MKAVIPAAGIGTRFLPLTKSMPKEMLPIVHKPVIQYVVEDIYAAGIRDILIITGPNKRAIEDYFDKNSNYKNNYYMDNLYKMLDDLNVFFVRQKQPQGLGDAISYAEPFVDGEPFAVALGDTITIPSCVSELLKTHNKFSSSVIAVEHVPEEKVELYGIITGQMIDETNYLVSELIEKPKRGKVISTLAILGSYILSPEIFGCIRKTPAGINGEIQLTDALKILKTLPKEKIIAHLYSGRRYDIGNKLDWLKANIELSLFDEEFGEDIDDFIKMLYEE